MAIGRTNAGGGAKINGQTEELLLFGESINARDRIIQNEEGLVYKSDGNIADVAAALKAGYAKESGLAGEMKKCVVLWRPVLSPVLSENSWHFISWASKEGLAPSIWSIGDEKDITLTTGEVLTLQIYGFNHDDKVGGGKAGITFGLKNLMADNRQMNAENTNAGGFTGSAMYTWLQGDLYNSLPSDLKNLIKSVNKKTSAGNQSSTINTNAMKIFLFSEVECFGTTKYSLAGEGSQYPIFTDNTSRIKKLENGAGAARFWWERSPNASIATSFCSVLSDGNANSNTASSSWGVCFGFCV